MAGNDWKVVPNLEKNVFIILMEGFYECIWFISNMWFIFIYYECVTAIPRFFNFKN